MTVEVQAAPSARPVPPKRTLSLAGPLLVALVVTMVGAYLGGRWFGLAWGVLMALGTLAALRLGRIPFDRVDGLILGTGFTASTVLATRVLPFAPDTLDVLLCLRFGLAWLPAGLATAGVVGRHGARPTTWVNSVVVWIAAGSAALPITEVLGVLKPIDTLRRNQTPSFGSAEYIVAGLVVTAVALAALLGVLGKVPALPTVTAVIIFTIFAGAAVGFSIPMLVRNMGNFIHIPNLWPPDFTWAVGNGTWWWLPSWEFGDPFLTNPLIETLRIAVAAATIGCVIALPIAFMASTLTAPTRTVYLIDKGFLNVVRTIPDLFWALILVASIGFGPFAGTIALIIFSMSIMAKLLSETIDAADPGPLEAAKAAGGTHFAAVRTSVLPQVLPNYAALSLYIFELNIRASAVLGIVGAGGIGRIIEARRTQAQFDRVLAILIPLLVIVVIVEQISVAIRRRLT